MTFAAPGLLAAGALAIALPVLIHLLFRRRKRPVPWAAMSILREAIRRTERRRRIERWVLLALRCLLVACVAAAVAEPLWRGADAATGSAASAIDAVIVLDDGVAQQCVSSGLTGLARAQADALAVLDALSAGDRAALVLAGSTDAGPRRAVWPPTSDLDRVRDAVRAAGPTSLPTRMPEALRMAAVQDPDAQDDSTQRRRLIAVCSDHRTGSWHDVDGAEQAAPVDERAESLAVVSEPAAGDPENAGIVAVSTLPRSPSTPEGAQALRVSLSRSATSAAASTSGQDILLDAGIATVRATVPWAEGQRESSVDTSLQLPGHLDSGAGAGHALSVSTVDSDAQPADNVRHAVIDASDALAVVIIDQAGDGASDADAIEGDRGARWIDRALRPVEDADVRVEVVDPASVSAKVLRDADAAVALRPDLLDESATRALADFARAGGVVVLFPPAARMASAWADRMLSACGIPWTASREPRDEAEGVTLAPEQPASALLAQLAPELRDLTTPVVINRRHSIEMRPASGDALLKLRDGSVLAASAPVGRGVVVLVAVAPEVSWSSMPVKPIMVPFMQEVIRQGAAIASSARSVRTGSMRIEPPSAAFGGGQLRMLDGSQSLSVSPDGALSEPLLRPGCAEVLDASGRRIALYAIDIVAAWADTTPTDASAVERRIAAAIPAQVTVGAADAHQQAIAAWRGASATVNAEAARGADGTDGAERGLSLAWIAFAAAVVVALAEVAMGRAASHAGVHAAAARRVA
jgi:hypothetical protein